jgi:hypothetical protein
MPANWRFGAIRGGARLLGANARKSFFIIMFQKIKIF